MANLWEQAPLVAQPASRAAWEDAPLVENTMTTEQQKWASDRTAAHGNIEKGVNAIPGFAAMSVLDPGGKSIISLPGRMVQGAGTRLYDSLHPQPKTPDENPAELARTTYNGLDITSPFDAGPSAPTPAQRAQEDQVFAHQMQTRGLTPEQQAHATELRNKHHGFKALDLPDDQFRQLLNRSGLGLEQQTELVRQRAERQAAKARADASKTTLGRIGMAADDTMRTVINNGPFVGAWANDLEGVTAGLMGGDREMETARQFAGDRERNRQFPVATTLGGLGSALATGGIATNAVRSGAPRLTAAIGAPATRAVAMAVGGPAAAATPAANWIARRGQNLAHGGIYGANYGAGQTEGGLDDKLKGGAIGGLAGAATAGALDTGLGMYNMGARALSNVANPSNGAYSQILDNMGGQTIDDLARSVEVGTTGAVAGTRAAALTVLGEEMTRTGNARMAIPATVRRLVNEHGMAQSTAQQHVRDLINTNRGSNLFFGEQPAVATGNLATRQLSHGDAGKHACRWRYQPKRRPTYRRHHC